MALALLLALLSARSLLVFCQRRAQPPPADDLEGPYRPDLNRAPAGRLLLLPGVGPSRAEAIVEDREEKGPFRSLRDLTRVRGLGPKTASGLAGRVRWGKIRAACPSPPARGGRR